jgi:antitoxin (DNA-binding transcriptional repressor) of toxin-antitoxin stability system
MVDRVVSGGEDITMPHDGHPVAELPPASQPPLTADALLARWRRMPAVDYRAMQADIDDVIDPAL